MSFLKELFDQFLGNTAKGIARTGKAQLRSATVGKVEGKVLNVQASAEQRVLRAQGNAIKRVTRLPGKQDTKMPQGQAPAAPQGQAPAAPHGRPPAGPPNANMQRPPMQQGGQQWQQGGQSWQQQGAYPQQPGAYPQQPGGMPNYGGGLGGGAEKTQAIDLRQFQDREKQVVGWLVATNGPHKGQDFRLYEGKNVLGTAADCEIVITDPYLSARHCTIRYENGNFVIIDLDSRNGTAVNQKRISKEDLIDNDTVRLGKTEFKFKALF